MVAMPRKAICRAFRCMAPMPAWIGLGLGLGLGSDKRV